MSDVRHGRTALGQLSGGPGWAAVGLLALLLINAVFVPGFLEMGIRDGHLYGALMDILTQGSKVVLLSAGMTLVVATGGVDLSVGSVMAVSGALAALGVTQTTLPVSLILGGAVLGGALLGAGNGVLVTALGIQPIIATLVLMVSGRGVAMLLTGGQIVTFETPALVFLGNGHWLGIPFPAMLSLGVVFGIWLVSRRSALGWLLEATGDNPVAARFCGVPTRGLLVWVYAGCGMCAALAGLLAASNIKAADSSRVGETMELDAIFAVVVGGTALTGGRFQLWGSVLGALLIQTLTTSAYSLGIPPAVAPVPKAVVVVTVCLLQSAAFRQVIARLARGGNDS